MSTHQCERLTMESTEERERSGYRGGVIDSPPSQQKREWLDYTN